MRLSPNGDVPPSPERWGWQRRDVGEELTWVPLTPQRIGWVDGEDLYLQPDAAYAAVRRLAQDEGDGVPLAPKTLWKRLDEKGLLASRDEDGRNLVRRTLGGDRRRVLHIAASTREGPMAGKSGQSDQPRLLDARLNRPTYRFLPSSRLEASFRKSVSAPS